jgi:thiol:disulfide interchange protein
MDAPSSNSSIEPGLRNSKCFSKGIGVNVRTSLQNSLILLMLAVAIGTAIAIQKERDATPRLASPSQVTRTRVDQALRKSKILNKILMVEFGGDWCEDCVVLNRNLEAVGVRDYFQTHFILLRVEVDQSDRNLDVAKSMDAGVEHGVPTAVFFGPDGARIGATNKGELEPSRDYKPDQILAFLKAVVDRRLIINPRSSF